MLKRATSTGCKLAAQIPAYAAGADEAKKRDAWMSGEPFGQGVTLRKQGLVPEFGPWLRNQVSIVADYEVFRPTLSRAF
jgi:hypothetical protein